MAKYCVTLFESYTNTFEVEANSKEHAIDKAQNMYWGFEIEAAVPVDGAKLLEGEIIAADLVEEKPSE